MKYLATIDKDKIIVESITVKDTLNAQQLELAKVNLIMLSEFKTHFSWDEMILKGMKIVILKTESDIIYT